MSLSDEQERITLIVIFVFGFFLRIVNIDALAPIVDETGALWESVSYSMYLPLDRLIGGKYLCYLFYKPIFLGAYDPLYFARVLTCLFSMVTMFFLHKTARIMGGGYSGLVASFLYAISPFALFHDRQVLFDPVATAFLSVSLYCFVHGFDSKKFFFLSGYFFLLMASSKIVGMASVPVFVTLAVFSNGRLVHCGRNGGIVGYDFSRLYLFPLGFLASLIALLLISPTPGYDLFDVKKTRDFLEHFLLKPSGTSHHLSELYTTTKFLLSGYFEYSGWFFLALIVISIIYCALSLYWLPVVLLVSALVSVLPFALLTYAFNRYIHFIQLPIYLGVALAVNLSLIRIRELAVNYSFVNCLQRRAIFFSVILLLSFVSSLFDQAYTSIRMMQNPYYRIANSDIFSYELGWPNAIGLDTVVTALEKIALHSEKKLYVVTIGWGMHGSWTLPLRFRNSRSAVSFYHSWIHSDWQRDELREVMKTNRLIFFLEYPVNFVEESDLLKIGTKTRVLFEYQKKDVNSRYVLVEVLNEDN